MKIVFVCFISLFVLASYGNRENIVSEAALDKDLKSIVNHLEKNFTGKMRETPHIAKAHFRETIFFK